MHNKYCYPLVVPLSDPLTLYYYVVLQAIVIKSGYLFFQKGAVFGSFYVFAPAKTIKVVNERMAFRNL